MVGMSDELETTAQFLVFSRKEEKGKKKKESFATQRCAHQFSWSGQKRNLSVGTHRQSYTH